MWCSARGSAMRDPCYEPSDEASTKLVPLSLWTSVGGPSIETNLLSKARNESVNKIRARIVTKQTYTHT